MNASLFPSQSWTISDNTVFRRTSDEFGGFSNFATKYRFQIKGFAILSSEHLYQAMRFPDSPDIQAAVLAADSPKGSKDVARKYDASTRADWMEIRVDVMRWVLGIKLVNHPKVLGKLLERTNGRPIVEYSKRDDFWGAKPIDKETLYGQNVLGRLLSEHRDRWIAGTSHRHVAPKPGFPKAKFLGELLD